jgi:hypothetical protein
MVTRRYTPGRLVVGRVTWWSPRATDKLNVPNSGIAHHCSSTIVRFSSSTYAATTARTTFWGNPRSMATLSTVCRCCRFLNARAPMKGRPRYRP